MKIIKDKIWFIGFILLALNISLVITIIVLYNSQDKLVCKSDNNKIILYYEDNKITDYSSKKIEFNLEGQNGYVKQIGIDKYLEEYTIWFKTNHNGKCIKK